MYGRCDLSTYKIQNTKAILTMNRQYINKITYHKQQ